MSTVDTLDLWLRLRPSLTPSSFVASSSPSSSRSSSTSTSSVAALRRHIERREGPRDPERARRLERAADLLESSVTEPLDVAHLAALSACIHGVDGAMPLRSRTAFAKGGRESMRPFESGELSAVLADAAAEAAGDTDSPVWLRAARLYADVCFFHPFDDGNGRLALVALVDVLQRARIDVMDLGPVVMPWTPSTVPTLVRVVRAVCRS